MSPKSRKKTYPRDASAAVVSLEKRDLQVKGKSGNKYCST